MKIRIMCLILVFISIISCKKSKTNVFRGDSNYKESFTFKSCSLLIAPNTLWLDSTEYSNSDVFEVVINPLDTNEVLYSVSNKIYKFNRLSKTKQLVVSGIHNNRFEINQYGDILFSNFLQLVCTVKSNGDSLKIYNYLSYIPYWDYTGRFIYYYVSSTLYKINASSGLVVAAITGLPRPFGFTKGSDKIICINASSTNLYLKDIVTGIESPLSPNLTGYFMNLTSDNYDNIYWWNPSGIYKLNYSDKKIDTLLTSCPKGVINNIQAVPNTYVSNIYISPLNKNLCFVYKHWIPLGGAKKYTVSYALEMDLATKKITEIKGMP